MKRNIQDLTHAQRRLRYSLTIDAEIFFEEHPGATPEDFIKAFNADEEWHSFYEGETEDIPTVLNEEIFPLVLSECDTE